MTVPVPHKSELPVAKLQCNKASEDLAVFEDIEEDFDDKFNISQTYMSLEPHFPSQQKMDDLVRDLELTKSNAELLTLRLKAWSLFDLSCRYLSSKKRHERFSTYFSTADSLCYCSNIDNLFE